ncbi:hypothetical protein NUQ43_07165 [Glaesserella parasuis]|nr:hypothetical protein [Glaesserella parasuis]
MLDTQGIEQWQPSIKNSKKWRAQVRRQGITKTATFTTRTEAVNWANFIEAEIEAGRYTNTPDVTFSALLMKYLQEVTCHKRGKREERFRILRIACTPLGEVKLNELAKEHFRAWHEVQPASVARERATLSAVIAKFLTTNPLKISEKIKLPAVTLSQILCKHPFQLNGDRLDDHQNQS